MGKILASIFEAIRRKVTESFSSWVADQIVDNALNSVQNIADFEAVFENLEKNLKSLSAEAADVEERITNGELSGRKKRKRQVEEWLEQVKFIEEEVVELGREVASEGFIMKLKDGGKAAQLDTKVKELVEQSRNFGELVLDVCGTTGDTFLTKGLVGQTFNENLETISRLLESGEVSSIGVYGMGGVGKTVLVKHVHNRLQQQCEGPVFWVTVSHEYTITGLQEKIARLLGVDLSDEDEIDKRACRIHRILSQMKNSVLILDGVWHNFDAMKVGCDATKECCRLIITTRSLTVCRQFRCQWEILVKKLEEGESWQLFKETLGVEIELDPEVEGIAKSMVNFCGGLPLGIITVAKSMKGKRAIKHTWENAYVELKERLVGRDGMSDDEVFKVLKYSFNQLNWNGKSDEFNTYQLCFLYCSLYPEDHEIHRGILVRNFISDGLVSQRKSRRARVQHGLSILDELVNLSLLEKCVDSDGEECVKMHDLVRDMALKIGEGRYMVRAGDSSLEEILDEEEWTKDLEKVSLANCDIYDISEEISPDCPKLSTLLLWSNQRLEAIPNSFFCKMQGLCTLDLGKTKVRMLPDATGDLVTLKSLLLENCENLESMPNLGNLRGLRELDLSCTAIKEVPRGLEELLKLEFLSLLAARNLTTLPSGLLHKLVHLQHVCTPFHLQAPYEEIQNLKLLEEFIGGVEHVKDFNCFIKSWQSHRGERATDTWYTAIVGGQHHGEEVVSFASSSYKKKLGLFGCNLEQGERESGQDTEHLLICECEGPSISLLNDFPGLKKLEIERCEGIECILRSEELMQIGEIGTSTAPMQPAVFSSLTVLLIVECNKMRKAGLPVSALPNLERITIESCGEMEEVFEEDEGTAAPILPKLKYLGLEDLPRLNSVSNATIICNSIEEISIRNCPRLMRKLPVHFNDLTRSSTLRRIDVDREWWESLDWNAHYNPDLPLLLQQFLNFW